MSKLASLEPVRSCAVCCFSIPDCVPSEKSFATNSHPWRDRGIATPDSKQPNRGRSTNPSGKEGSARFRLNPSPRPQRPNSCCRVNMSDKTSSLYNRIVCGLQSSYSISSNPRHWVERLSPLWNVNHHLECDPAS